MNHRIAPVTLAFFSAIAVAQDRPRAADEQLIRMVNAYRVEQGLNPVASSPSLTQVAVDHVKDLERSPPGGQCNNHSWSSAGKWTTCCYTADHAQARCMWDKPREITGGAYRGNGYEIAHHGMGGVTPEGALRGWKNSAGHNSVMVNQGKWANAHWQAIGAAVSEHYAVIWFGKEADPAIGR